MILLAMDPGIRGCGVATFEDGVLIEALYIVSPCKTGNKAAECSSMASWIYASVARVDVDELVVEWPRIYASRIREGSSKADPNDLLALCGVDAALAALLAPAKVTSYVPSEWKGSTPKEVCEARIKARLNKFELTVYAAAEAASKSKFHNVVDSIGISLFHLGRFDRKRAI